MSISFECPNCEKKIRADDRLSGTMSRCPRCGAKLQVPGPAWQEEIPSRQELPPAPVALERPEPEPIFRCPFCSSTRKTKRKPMTSWRGWILCVFFFVPLAMYSCGQVAIATTHSARLKEGAGRDEVAGEMLLWTFVFFISFVCMFVCALHRTYFHVCTNCGLKIGEEG